MCCFISFHLSFFRSIMTAICHIPLAFVEKESFRKFMEIACPSFQIPNRQQLRNKILEQAHLTKEKVHFHSFFFLTIKIKEVTLKATFPCYCIDLWKSKARVCSTSSFHSVTLSHFQDYYIGATLQFIDKEWKLWNLPIGFKQILGSHTAMAVGKQVAEMIRPFIGLLLSSVFPGFLSFSRNEAIWSSDRWGGHFLC